MVSPVLIAAPVTIIPGILALWYLLKRYEDYFEDARVFLALTFGLFGGLVAAFLEWQMFQFHTPEFQASVGVATGFILFVSGYAVFETLVKAAVLGLKKYRGRKDAPYYGTALGVGLSAMMGLGFVSINLNVSEEIGNPYQIVPFLAMAALPLGAIFAHAGSSAYLGLHMGDNKPAKGILIGAGFMMPSLAAQWLFLQSAVGQGNQVAIFPAIFSVAYGFFLLWIARNRVLDVIVPQEIQDRVRRERRREARKE